MIRRVDCCGRIFIVPCNIIINVKAYGAGAFFLPFGDPLLKHVLYVIGYGVTAWPDIHQARNFY